MRDDDLIRRKRIAVRKDIYDTKQTLHLRIYYELKYNIKNYRVWVTVSRTSYHILWKSVSWLIIKMRAHRYSLLTWRSNKQSSFLHERKSDKRLAASEAIDSILVEKGVPRYQKAVFSHFYETSFRIRSSRYTFSFTEWMDSKSYGDCCISRGSRNFQFPIKFVLAERDVLTKITSARSEGFVCLEAYLGLCYTRSRPVHREMVALGMARKLRNNQNACS